MLAVAVSHNMIKEKMEAKKEAASKGTAKRAGDRGRGAANDDGD